MKHLAAAFGIICILCSASASAGDSTLKLFKDYAYGSDSKTYEGKKGYYDCSSDFGGGAICKDGIQFLGEEFIAVLAFSEKQLSRVSLVAESSPSTFTKLAGGISQSFTLVAIGDGKSQLDILHTIKTDPQAKINITNFETAGINSGNITYTFLEGLGPIAKSASAYDALSQAPVTIRSAELIVAGQGPESAIVVRFSMPKQEALKLNEARNKPAESF